MATVDKKLSGQRGKGRRIQPYAWLGAGAVTLGLGAAMASGAAVAHAEDGSDAGTSGVSHSQDAGPSSDSSSKGTRATKRSAPSSSVSGAKRASSARSANTTPDSDTAEAGDTAAPAATAVSGNSPVADVTPKAPTRSHRTAAVHPAAEVANLANVDAQAAAANSPTAPSTASLPVPNQGQFIPTTITPGAHVQLAFDGIDAAKTALNANTWQAGNILGGLAAIAPQSLLSAASVELSMWQTLNPIAQNLMAATAGIPIVHQLAQVSLLGTMLLPGLSQASLKGATLLMPVVGLFAPSAEAAASPLIDQATQDGRVYAIVRLKVYNITEPLVDAKINGSSKQALLVDSGSSGLVIDAANAGTLDPANKVNVAPQNGSYSGGFDYTYDTYKNTTVDFGNGVVSEPTYVNVVTSGTYQGNPTTLEEFLTNAGAVGILGIGANAYAPGPNPIPTSTLPGELSDGMLIYQNLLPLGLGGFVVFGPNPLPPKATLSGTPTTTVKVSINDGTQQDVVSLIDSGGVYGTMPENVVAPDIGGYVPAGTKISVYAPDGTFLYKFTVGNAPYAPVSVGPANELPDGNYMNTGYYAYKQGPVYIDYRNDGTYNNGGYGWTVFDIK